MIGQTARLAACIVALLAVLAWDIATAGRVARHPKAPSGFRALTGIAGFLVTPALLTWVAGQSALTGHALLGLRWLWPVVTLLFVVQVADAMERRLVAPMLGVPLLALNLLVAIEAVVQYAGFSGHDLPVAALIPGIARARAIGAMLGRSVMTSPLAMISRCSRRPSPPARA